MVSKLFKKKTDSVSHEETLECIEDQVFDSGKNVDEIKEHVIDAGKDVDEIKEDVGEIYDAVDEIKEDVDELIKKQDSILKKFALKLKPDKFSFDDIAQQIVGAIIISSPLAVTEEVWMLSGNLDFFRIILLLGITLLFDILLIYFTKYQHVEKESMLKFIPTRLFSLLVVSYIAAAFILYLFGVIGGQITTQLGIVKLIIFVGLFANIGAGAADMLR